MIARRGFLTGLFSAMAAPAIVRAASLMPVKALPFLRNLTTQAVDFIDFAAVQRDLVRLQAVPTHWLTDEGQRQLRT